MSEEEQAQAEKEEFSDEQLRSVIRRLRICQLPGSKMIGMVPKGKEDDETTILENVMAMSIRPGPMGMMPVIMSIDFCALALPKYEIKQLAGEYRTSWLQEDDAFAYARVYLRAVEDLIRQKEMPDDPNQIIPGDPRAMEMLNRMAQGGQLPPGMTGMPRGPGGRFIPRG